VHHRVALIPPLLLAGVLLGGGCENEETGGGPTACEDLLVQEPCLDCLETSCCEQVQACFADQEEGGCAACIQGDAEACTGSAAACPIDTFEPATTVCRGSMGACDQAGRTVQGQAEVLGTVLSFVLAGIGLSLALLMLGAGVKVARGR